MDYSHKLTFTTREQYLAYRAEWRHDYRALSETIRSHKVIAANMSRKGAFAGNIQALLQSERKQALAMMEERAESKLLCAHQRSTMPLAA